ncbi:hypothetical protein AMELA_G00153340 [Ameiurus melas]|uniref:IRS-type PTB domain-containing protein n=1 Tax=Ameiurus melas TaxID=219545 RepID=A0A7J6AKH0_AMEME|nr:hypothetical protein AMELA_G00153340 [Ameiurus melas]
MMEGDVRMKGMLYQQQQRFGKKWKKVWAEAIADSTHSVSRLEIFEFTKSSMKEGKKRAEGRKVIVMRDCVKITEGQAEGCPKECSTFLLETADKTHIFAAPTSELQIWIAELCKLAFPLRQAECRSQKQDHHQPVEMEENTLYGTSESVRDFLVIAVATEAALRCELYGEYFLTPQHDSLLLKDHKTKQVLLTWPYRFVRKFGQDMLAFNFEAGRRCESGEGYFEFATSHSDRLFTIISGALKKLPKVETSGTRPKEQQSHTPPTQIKHPKKKLTTSLSLNSINVGDNPSKDSKVKSIKNTPPLSSNVQDAVYAMINKPNLHPKSTNDYKNQQFYPLPELDTLPEDIFGVLEDKDQTNPEQLVIHTEFKDDKAEAVYSEVANYADYVGKNEAVDNIVDFKKPYSHNLTVCSDLNNSHAVGFNKGYKNQQSGPPSDFLKLSKDIPCIIEEEQLDMFMEQLAIQHTPNVHGDEMYSEVMDYYDDYVDNEESVDNVEDQDYFYPPCDTHFQMDPSNLEDSQNEEFCTYDNLPKRL